MKIAHSLIAFGQMIFAQSIENADEYPRWSEQMDKHGYTWEAFDVTTEDHYELTLFHITGSKEHGKFSPTKDPVLV